MRTRTYEVKDSTGALIESGVKGWWNHTIVLSDLSPHPTLSISGMVAARGGWCKVGEWQTPEKSYTLQCSALEWAEMLAEELDKSPYVGGEKVIDSIAKVLERLEDKRLNPAPTPAPQPIPEEPTVP